MSTNTKTPIVHLVGTDPVSGRKFLPKFPITDRDWELDANKEILYKTTKFCRLVASDPNEDPKQVSLKSIEQLEFVLANADPWDWYEVGNITEEFSYNVSLRLLGTLAKHTKLWFGIAPQRRYSENWKICYHLPKEETENQALNTSNWISPERILSQGTGKTETLLPTETFHNKIVIHEGFSVQVGETTYALPTGIPFVATLMVEDDILGITSRQLEVVMNPAFVDLCKTQPEAAQEMYEDAISDCFIEKRQSDEQCQYTWDDFLMENQAPVYLRFDLDEAKKTTEKKLHRETLQIVKQLIALHADEIRDIAHNWDTIFHVKSFRLEKSGFSLDATLEIPSEVIKIRIDPKTGTSITRTQRIRN